MSAAPATANRPALYDEAAWRDLTVGQLALRIIETVVTEGLIAAVLDDEETKRD